jgi:hypothetical protein
MTGGTFLFYSSRCSLHAVVICECLVEGQAKWEKEGGGGGIQESDSQSVSVRSCFDTDWRDPSLMGGKGW